MPPVVPPIPDRTDQYFWDGVSAGQLLIQRCTSCHTLRLPPVPMCGTCHATTWDTVAASGRGTVYSWILSHHPSEPDATPRVVVLVQLEEGPRFVSNLIDVDTDEVRNDMAVKLCFREVDGVTLPQFQIVAPRPERVPQ